MIDTNLITVVIKTFERPQACARLISSVRKYYPDVPIIVVDDSRSHNLLNMAATKNMLYLKMEFDIGVSAGRNEAMRHVRTPYVWIGDDDCEFTPETDLSKAMNMLDEWGLDMLGMQASGVHYNGRYEVKETNEGTVVRMLPNPREKLLSANGTVEIYDFVPNIFVAKTHALRTHPWDEELKIGEHFAHFFEYRGMLRVGYTEEISITHGGISTSGSTYQQHRSRALDYLRSYMRRKGIRKRIDLLGQEVQV